jgi:hypothetical protein
MSKKRFDKPAPNGEWDKVRIQRFQFMISLQEIRGYLIADLFFAVEHNPAHRVREGF